MSDYDIPRAIARALASANLHPAVTKVEVVSREPDALVVAADITFGIDLASKYRAAGESPKGVRQHEPVRIYFPASYPLDAPALALRPDFSRSFPHIQPWLHEGCPVPCVFDGKLADLLHQQGFLGLLNQISDWLEKAANDELIDSSHGWEPVRRDGLRNVIIADSQALRSLDDQRGGFRVFRFTYVAIQTRDSSDNWVYGQVLPEQTPLSAETFDGVGQQNGALGNPELTSGASLAVVVWPGKEASGRLAVADEYAPETVKDIASLQQRARDYGCERGLNSALDRLAECVDGARSQGATFPLAVVLLARRPVNLIGSDSPVELCPYLTSITAPSLLPEGDKTLVSPAGHHDAITRQLLQTLSTKEDTVNSEVTRWSLLGSGSLGSKVAIHLGRSGMGPQDVVDPAHISPHNAARHALLPGDGQNSSPWLGSKATLLTHALKGLGQDAEPHTVDALDALRCGQRLNRALSSRAALIVNATASLRVREGLANSDIVVARVVECMLFGGGSIGLITTEGPDRNPNGLDLMAELYALALERPDIYSEIFGGDVERIGVGQGCGSRTMVMPDARLSLHAAGVAEYVRDKLSSGLDNDGGEILFGELEPNGLGVRWNQHRVQPTTVLEVPGNSTWRVHLHERAQQKIGREIRRFPSVETGGVLVGRISEINQTFNVVDVLDAPADSKREAHLFELGTEGLSALIRKVEECSHGTLICLGTWHSHIAECGPSAVDKLTADRIAVSRITPSVLLIRTPKRFHAVLADRMERDQPIDE